MKSYQDNGKRIAVKNGSLILLYIFVLLSPFLIIESLIPAFFASFTILLIYVCLLFFWLNFIPSLPRELIGFNKITFTLLLKSFFNLGTIININNGNFDRDYFALQHKPRIIGLIIDEQSAVILKNSKNKRKILYCGFYQPENDEEVIHTFKLNPLTFTHGAIRNHNAFHKPEVLKVKYKDLILHSKMSDDSRKIIVNEIILEPKFSVFYAFKPGKHEEIQNEKLLSISNQFEREGIVGELTSPFEEVIVSIILNNFQKLLNKYNLEKIQKLDRFPYEHITSINNQMDMIFSNDIPDILTTSKLEAELLSLFTLKVYLETVLIR